MHVKTQLPFLGVLFDHGLLFLKSPSQLSCLWILQLLFFKFGELPEEKGRPLIAVGEKFVK